MPTYPMTCKDCGKDQDVFAWVSEYERGLSCECGHTLARRKFDAPALVGAENPEYAKREKARVPINIIDEKPDGSFRVTRIGKKKDIDND